MVLVLAAVLALLIVEDAMPRLFPQGGVATRSSQGDWRTPCTWAVPRKRLMRAGETRLRPLQAEMRIAEGRGRHGSTLARLSQRGFRLRAKAAQLVVVRVVAVHPPHG